MKPKTKKPLSPAKAIQNEIRTLNRAETKVLADDLAAAKKRDRRCNRELVRLQNSITRLKEQQRREDDAQSAAVNRTITKIERRRSVLEARLANL